MSGPRRAVIGTAGHIDHGKTALVRALTGVDTDRLPEEKARGITIDLGFAELPADGDLHMGVVDVPGHEDFVRAMVAGATGVDVALLIVAADEGVMPQTREHLDILGLLGIPELVVAVTKVDAVEPDWLALVEEDVRDLLGGTLWPEAPLVPTSVVDGRGLDTLRAALAAAARKSRSRDESDLARLPVDRVFSLQGTGTVVTGTLWSGTLRQGEKVRLVPHGPEARIRSLQVHGRDVAEARAGERTAVALVGADRHAVDRGTALVAAGAWEPTWMLTARIGVLHRTAWSVAQGQRVRVHVGTAEVLARCVVLGTDELSAGEQGWVQLRLEAPLLARARDRVVLRSYSPVTTIAGGLVAEPGPPKRKRLAPAEVAALEAVLNGEGARAVEAVVSLSGWSGVATARLPIVAGCSSDEVEGALATLIERGGLVAKAMAFGSGTVGQAEAHMLEALRSGHQETPLRPVVALERLRSALPSWAPPALAEGVLDRLHASVRVELAEGGARLPGFTPSRQPDQVTACAELEETYRSAGLAPPLVDELPPGLRARPDLTELLRYLESAGILRTVDEGMFAHAGELDALAGAVRAGLGGRTDLGPADFREILPVSRRHLMPLLAYLDGVGVTVRRGPVRDVPGDR